MAPKRSLAAILADVASMKGLGGICFILPATSRTDAM